ncbi:two-component system response regulator [Gilvimarinus agarilyticus]|uniref:response regulator n=1 Tax=unclassified Gilvimarinus TaxID=2642066 RepID=UPI001C0A2F98|nr:MULTISPECIES: two-component system response regulator [unclassified Gilvimarinus]MBU2887791.1 two-component system response regulator [Gilvimarinus agarilyticus]MDO6572430.1 two-component system response regulator [Gilvimarinus sp. 2_MG-2023]MDO6746574.1 two-component system response regulator [Gilvimarinus sp. 1_MG-2023]
MPHNPLRILVVDDEPTNLKVMQNVLADTYQLSFAKSGQAALKLADEQVPNLILLDVMMPEMSGIEVCKALKNNPNTQHIPVIFVTALSDNNDEFQGFEVGAVDYIIKPITPALVRARVRTHLSLVQAEQLKKAHVDLVQRLGAAAEYKDEDTGEHILRMSRYSKALALAHGINEDDAEIIRQAAPMHDVGKIGIPDAILLKPGKLTHSEFDKIKEHTTIGGKILENSDSPLLRLAHKLAMEHHEKWDGSGYPYGLQGEQISIEARIVTLADVFDALTSKRPYKEAWPTDQAFEYIAEQAGKHFDPVLTATFLGIKTQLLDIKQRYNR